MRKVESWEFYNDNIEVCDVVRSGGVAALERDDRVVAEWCIQTLAGCSRVLDLGCGSGFPGLYVAPHVAEIVGVDAAPNMVAAARENAARLGVANAEFEIGRAQQLRFPDGEFDGALLCGVLESMDWGTVRQAIHEVSRMVACAGRIAVADRDWAGVLRACPSQEVAVRRHEQGFLLRFVERVCRPGLERDVRYVIGSSDELGEALRSQLGDQSWAPVQVDVDQIPAGAVLDAWYDEVAQFDDAALTDLVTSAGFCDVALERLPVWEHGVLALAASAQSGPDA